MIGARVLVVESDPGVGAALIDALRDEGVSALGIRTAEACLAQFDDAPAQAIVLSMALAGADGRDVCSALRARGADAPIVLLMEPGSLDDRLSGFAAGGDACLATPVELPELVARLRVLIRRTWRRSDAGRGLLDLDPLAHGLRTGDGRVGLTPIEFRILARLATRAGETVSRRDLIRIAWPGGTIVNDNSLEAHVARLRRKLGGVAGATIATTHRIGYRLESLSPA